MEIGNHLVLAKSFHSVKVFLQNHVLGSHDFDVILVRDCSQTA